MNQTILREFQRKEKPAPSTFSDLPSLTWKLYKERAKTLESIDFGCKIDSAGHCKKFRAAAQDPERQSWQTDEMLCCANCNITRGYLGEIEPGSAKRYARRWNNKTGFWRKGKGCNLPREMRSLTCLGYHCSPEWKDFWPRSYVETGDTKFIQISNAQPSTN